MNLSMQIPEAQVIPLELIERISQIQIVRNKLAHAEWDTLDKNGFVRTRYSVNSESGLTESKRDKLDEETISLYLSEINNIIAELDEFDWL